MGATAAAIHNPLVRRNPLDHAGGIGAKTLNASLRAIDAPLHYIGRPILGEAVRHGYDPAGIARDMVLPHEWSLPGLTEYTQTMLPGGVIARGAQAARRNRAEDQLDWDQQTRINEAVRDDTDDRSRAERNRDLWRIGTEGRPIERFLTEAAVDPLNVIGIGRVTPLVRGARAGVQARGAARAGQETGEQAARQGSRAGDLVERAALGVDAAQDAVVRASALPLVAGLAVARGAARLPGIRHALDRTRAGWASLMSERSGNLLDQLSNMEVMAGLRTDPEDMALIREQRNALSSLTERRSATNPLRREALDNSEIRQATTEMLRDDPLTAMRAWNELNVRDSMGLQTRGYRNKDRTLSMLDEAGIPEVNRARYDALPEVNFGQAYDDLSMGLYHQGLLEPAVPGTRVARHRDGFVHAEGGLVPTPRMQAHLRLDRLQSREGLPFHVRQRQHEELDRAAREFVSREPRMVRQTETPVTDAPPVQQAGLDEQQRRILSDAQEALDSSGLRTTAADVAEIADNLYLARQPSDTVPVRTQKAQEQVFRRLLDNVETEDVRRGLASSEEAITRYADDSEMGQRVRGARDILRDELTQREQAQWRPAYEGDTTGNVTIQRSQADHQRWLANEAIEFKDGPGIYNYARRVFDLETGKGTHEARGKALANLAMMPDNALDDAIVQAQRMAGHRGDRTLLERNIIELLERAKRGKETGELLPDPNVMIEVQVDPQREFYRLYRDSVDEQGLVRNLPEFMEREGLDFIAEFGTDEVKAILARELASVTDEPLSVALSPRMRSRLADFLVDREDLVDQRAIYTAADTLDEVLTRRAQEIGAPEQNARGVYEMMEPVVGRNPKHFEAFHAVVRPLIRDRLDEAMLATDPRIARELVAEAVEQLDGAFGSFGVLHPRLYQIARRLLPDNRGLRQQAETGATARRVREDIDPETGLQLEGAERQRLIDNLHREGPLTADAMTDAQRLFAMPDVQQELRVMTGYRREMDQVLRSIREANPQADFYLDSFATKEDFLKVVNRFGSKKQLARMSKVMENQGLPGTAEGLAHYRSNLMKAAARGVRDEYGLRRAPELRSKEGRKATLEHDPGFLHFVDSEFRWLARAFREQALLTPRWGVVNFVDMTLKSALEGVNPLIAMGPGKFIRRLGKDVHTPESFRTSLGIDREGSAFQSLGVASSEARDLGGFTEFAAGSDVDVSFAGLIARFLDADAHAATMNRTAAARIPGLRHLYAPLIDFNLSLNRGMETSFRDGAWMTGARRYLKQNFDGFLDGIHRRGRDAGVDSQQLSTITDELRHFGEVNSPEAVRATVQAHTGNNAFATDVSNDWFRLVGEASEQGVELSNRIHFRYGDVRNADELLRRTMTFHVWATRNIPYYSAALAENPWLMRAYVRWNEITGEEREQQGLTARVAGRVAVPYSDNRFLSWIFGDGVSYFNPMVAFSIWDQFKPQYVHEDQSALGRGVQQASRMGIVPLPWFFNVGVIAGAFGEQHPERMLPYQGSLATGVVPHRYADVAMNLAEYLGVPAQDLDLSRKGEVDLLRWAARRASGIIPGTDEVQLHTISGDPFLDREVAREIHHIALQETGGRVSDEYLAAIGNPINPETGEPNPLYEEAERRVRRRRIPQDIYAATSPFPHVRISPEEHRIRQDRQHIFDYDDADRQRFRDEGRVGAVYDSLRYDPAQMEIDAGFAVMRMIGWNQPDEVQARVEAMLPEWGRFRQWQREEGALGRDTHHARYLGLQWYEDYEAWARERGYPINDQSRDLYWRLRNEEAQATQASEPDVTWEDWADEQQLPLTDQTRELFWWLHDANELQ